MASHLNEEALWATALAGRLRLVQANCVEQPPETRQEFLAEEIERALKDVPPSKRKPCLEALGDQFPAWQIAALPDAATSAKADVVEDTPERRLESLLKITSQLTPEQKKVFAQKLVDAGLAVTESRSGPVETPPELQKLLNLPQGRPLEGDRAIKMLAELAQFVFSLEPLVWNSWKQIAPRSAIRKEHDPKAMAAKYLGGDGEISAQQLKQILEQTRKLIIGLLMAMGGAGRKYAETYLERFAPEAIRSQAEMMKGRFMASIEEKSWNRYLDVPREFATEQVIEKEIQEAVVKFAEEVMRGRYANP
jgi:hypothetical protein